MSIETQKLPAQQTEPGTQDPQLHAARGKDGVIRIDGDRSNVYEIAQRPTEDDPRAFQSIGQRLDTTRSSERASQNRIVIGDHLGETASRIVITAEDLK